MKLQVLLPEISDTAGVLIDTNLLVVLVVGSVGVSRIGRFKRTSKYSAADYRLLVDIAAAFDVLYTVPHALAEVSNLTDLTGEDLFAARQSLRQMIAVTDELAISSRQAADNPVFTRLGLTDAAILAAAHQYGFSVITDDLAFYWALMRARTPAANYTYIRQRAGIV